MAKARLSILVNASGSELAADHEIAALVVPTPHEWRLSSGNGRELGRSARAFADADVCRRDLLELQARVTEASVLISSAGGGGCWTWRLQLGPTGPAAIGGRRYARRRECRYNLDRFVEALADLEPPRDLFGLTFRRLVSAPTIDLTDGRTARTVPPTPTSTGSRGASPSSDTRATSAAREAPRGPQACVALEPVELEPVAREPVAPEPVATGQAADSALERRAVRVLRTRPAPAPLVDRRVQPLVVAPAPRLAWQPTIRLSGYR